MMTGTEDYWESILLIPDHQLQVLPKLALKLGLNEAMFVQQLHYWLCTSEHEFDGSRWVYNTAKQWREQFPFWSIATIRRIVQNLKLVGLIQVTDAYNQAASDRTLWYTIDYAAMKALENRKEQYDYNELREQGDQSANTPDQSANTPDQSANTPDQPANLHMINLLTSTHDQSANLIPKNTQESTQESTRQREPARKTKKDFQQEKPYTGKLSQHRRSKKDRHIWDPRKVDKNGYVTKGAGTSPVEVYYENALIGKYALSPSGRDMLMEQVTNLEKWRWVLLQADLRGFKSQNVQARMDVYHNGFRDGTTFEGEDGDNGRKGRGEAGGETGWEWDDYGICRKYPEGRQPTWRGYAHDWQFLAINRQKLGMEEAASKAKALNIEHGFEAD